MLYVRDNIISEVIVHCNTLGDDGMNSKIFLSINEAATVTGLSRDFLRAGCKAGSIPHVRSGVKYLINLPLLLERLSEREVETDEK